jgi:hypothetical protein
MDTSQVWHGDHYQRTSLAKAGLIIQLNHGRNSLCASPSPFLRDFTVVHVNGQHDVKISYCGCKTHIKGNGRVEQLLRQHWMPATWRAPRTVFTFQLLNTFHLLNLQAKCNLYDFYNMIVRQTNNDDLAHLPVSSHLGPSLISFSPQDRINIMKLRLLSVFGAISNS